MKLLKRLYEIHSPSRNENRIRTFIKQYVSKTFPMQSLNKMPSGIYILPVAS